MTLKLFYSPGACSMSAHIALEEAGATYETEVVKLAENAQRTPEYLAVNPRGRLPALKLDDGSVLTECAGILTYVANQYPKSKLWPESATDRGRCVEWMSWLASYVHVAYAQTRRPYRFVGQNEHVFPQVRQAGGAHLRVAYKDIEERLSKTAYAVGDSISVADLHLFVFYQWGKGAQLVGPVITPAFSKWGAKMNERASVKKVADIEGLKLT